MKLRAYRLPLKDRDDAFYLPKATLPLDWPYFFGSHLPYYEYIVGRDYGLYWAISEKGESVELELLSPSDGDVNNRELRGKLLDTIYKSEKRYSDLLYEISKLRFSLDVSSLWMRYGFPALLLPWAIINLHTPWGLSYTILSLYLLKGRELLVEKKVLRGLKDFYRRIADGLERAIGDIKEVRQRPDPGMKKLRRLIEKSENKTEAYINAGHACTGMGFPEFKEFYLKTAPILEWKHKEVGTPFTIKDRYATPRYSFKKITYAPFKRTKEPGVEIFDYKVGAKFLSSIGPFKDLEKALRKVSKNIGAEQITIWTSTRGQDVNLYVIGNKKAEERFLFCTGHEDEYAAPLAIYQMMKSFEKEGAYTEEVLSKACLYFLPDDDPDGFDMRAWTAVDMDGEEYHWPPEAFHSMIATWRKIGLKEALNSPLDILTKCCRTRNAILDHSNNVRYRDENGVYGDSVKSDRIWAIEQAIKEVRPTYAIDFHETVRDHVSWFIYEGCGPLLIEDFDISAEDWESLDETIKRPFRITNVFSSVPRAKVILESYPEFEVGEAMLDHTARKGLRRFEAEWQALLEAPAIYPQLIAVGRGRSVDGPLIRRVGTRVRTRWMIEECGTNLAITSETFGGPVDMRVRENMALAEGMILRVLKLGKRK